jgi:hypothetical protein
VSSALPLALTKLATLHKGITMNANAAIALLILIPFAGFCVYTLIHVINTVRKTK